MIELNAGLTDQPSVLIWPEEWTEGISTEERSQLMPKAKVAVPKKPTPAKAPVQTNGTRRSVVSDDAIRLRAYLKWEAAGKPPGDGVAFWLAARQELNH
jgi:hypothetical protein